MLVDPDHGLMSTIHLTRKQRILRLSGFFGFLFIYVLLLWLSCNWVFNQVALRVAFGSECAARERITVDHVTKPSTVTFSNGQSVDVGMAPARAVVLCAGVGLIPYLLCVRYLVRSYLHPDTYDGSARVL